MADVFVSYANQDRERVRKLVNAIELCGWSIWWDRKIVPGQTFDQVIEHELEMAKCIVVLWSNNSISSEWVKNEASFASERGVLVPVVIDRVKPPLEFRRKQTSDMVAWGGDHLHEGFQALCDGIVAATKISHTIPDNTIPPKPKFRLSRRWALSAIISLAFVLVFVAMKDLSNTIIIKSTDKTNQTNEPSEVNKLIVDVGAQETKLILEKKQDKGIKPTVKVVRVAPYTAVYIEPGMKRLGQFKQGTVLKVIGNIKLQDGVLWEQVEFRGLRGYVKTSHLK
jgi:hypothetical protein